MFKQNNKINYLKIYTIISAILSITYIIILSIIIHKNIDIKEDLKLFCFCIIPFVCSYFISIVGNHTHKNYPKITKIITNIINLSVLVIHGIYISIIFLVFCAFSSIDNTEYTEIEDYPKALDSYQYDAIQHFPAQIPQNAERIKMKRSPDSFTGDSEFYLQFDIEKEYIENEKSKFKDKSEIYILNKNDYFTSSNYNKEKESAIILNSIIDENIKGWEMIFLERNQCFRGIAFKDNTIIYILSCD